MTKVEALKQLAVALGCATEVAEVTGDTVAGVLLFIVENYEGGGEIPTKTSQLINDSGFITKTVDDLTNYPKIALPTEAGTYQLTIAEGGVASWTKVESDTE